MSKGNRTQPQEADRLGRSSVLVEVLEEERLGLILLTLVQTQTNSPSKSMALHWHESRMELNETVRRGREEEEE